MPQLEVGMGGGTLRGTLDGTGGASTFSGTLGSAPALSGCSSGTRRPDRLTVPRRALCGLPLVHALPTAGRGRPRRR
ncbi:hypothetical protein ABZX40_06680 [Streptomyces sp. NPDC004610]|uniref:hypothetical protein n=1 Tax=unclassified Streptomyces TaxID=2593676 RepID=UPI0033A8160D